MNRRIAAEQQMNTGKCNGITEVYSRVTGYFSPLKRWNRGKRAEYSERVAYRIDR